MQNLIVFPGLSSPCNSKEHKYTPPYEALIHEAKERGVNIEILRYPGQISKHGIFSGIASPESFIAYALDVIRSYEDKKQTYHTLGISNGCSISLATSLRVKKLCYWKQAIIWGPIPHWMIWRSFGQESRNANLGKGTKFIEPHQNFYYESTPNEHLIQRVEIPITTCIGGDDKYVGKEYLEYLNALCRNVITKRYFHYLPGCQHNVTQDDPGYDKYIELIFSKIQK